MDEGTRRCCQHRACVDWDLHELYAMSKKFERTAKKDSTTVAAPIGAGQMSHAVVGVDEAVSVDDGNAGDGLVLDEDERGGRAAAAATEVAAAAAKEERRRQRLGYERDGDARSRRRTLTA